MVGHPPGPGVGVRHGAPDPPTAGVLRGAGDGVRHDPDTMPTTVPEATDLSARIPDGTAIPVPEETITAATPMAITAIPTDALPQELLAATPPARARLMPIPDIPSAPTVTVTPVPGPQTTAITATPPSRLPVTATPERSIPADIAKADKALTKAPAPHGIIQLPSTATRLHDGNQATAAARRPTVSLTTILAARLQLIAAAEASTTLPVDSAAEADIAHPAEVAVAPVADTDNRTIPHSPSPTLKGSVVLYEC